MTHNEAHIILDQKFDKIGTDRYDDLEIEEKDLWLYEAVMSFVKERTKPQPYWDFKFQETKAQYDNLENLVSRVDVPLVIVDDNTVRGELPSDYFMAIAEEVKSLVCPTVEVDTASINKSFFVLPWPEDTRMDRVHNYYANLRLGILQDDLSYDYVYNETFYPDYVDGVLDESLYYMLVRHFVERQREINLFDYQVYWEWYDGKFYPNCLIVEDNTGNSVFNLTVFFDGIADSTVSQKVVDYDKYLTAVSKTSRYTAEARLVRHENLRNILNNSMFTTTFDSPIVSMNERNILVHHNSDFIPETLTLTYLRKPKAVDHRSNTFTEIDSGFHSDIINETVEQLTAALATETHKFIKQDNFNNE